MMAVPQAIRRWRTGAPMVAAVAACMLVSRLSRAEEVGDGGDVKLLRRQVEYLAESLAVAKAEIDVLKAWRDREAFESAGGGGLGMVADSGGLSDREYRILEVSKELGIAVLSAGRRQGIRPGLEFAVVRGQRSVAVLKVIDARSAVAGAVVLRVSGDFPRAQDRVILVTAAKE